MPDLNANAAKGCQEDRLVPARFHGTTIAEVVFSRQPLVWLTVCLEHQTLVHVVGFSPRGRNYGRKDAGWGRTPANHPGNFTY